jgi:FAD-dependent urate hydroxylase
MRNRSSLPILIVGAGVGGLTAACALRQKGFSVEIFERAEKPILDAGTGLCLWSNATTCLNRLGFRAQVRDAGAAIEKVEIRTGNGFLLAEDSIHRLSKQVGAPSVGIRHSALMQILLNACQDIPIHFSSRAVAYSAQADGVVLRLEGGQEVTGQAVIAADGLASALRAQLVSDGAPTYTGHTLWQGISQDLGNMERGTVYTVWGTHDVHAGCWQVDDHQAAWFVRVDAPAGSHDAPGTLMPRLRDLTKGMHGPLAQLLTLTPEERISRMDVYARTTVAFVRLDPVALLGNAAHAMPNVFRQSAGQTIEDGVVLAESLYETPNAMDGLALYEKRRLPRIKWVREQIYRYDRIEEAEHPLLFWMRNRASRLVARDTSTKMWRGLVTFRD